MFTPSFVPSLLLSIAAFGQAAAADHRSELAFRIPERDLFPEGIAYDPVSDTFFLGSVRKRKNIAAYSCDALTLASLS